MMKGYKMAEDITCRALYRIAIYQLYRYFGYMIHMGSFFSVTSNNTFLFKFMLFLSSKFPNSHEIIVDI